MKYDSILYITEPANILESDRMVGSGNWSGAYKSVTGYPYTTDDPKMYNAFTFGKIIRNAVNSMGSGWSSEVSDFKKWVVVRVSYHNYETSRTSTKTFLIVFQHKGDGIVLSTHNRYRTISGADQAVSYIRSACAQLQNSTQNRI